MADEPAAGYEDKITEHYRREAEEHGTAGSSTMRDEITRTKELDAIGHVLAHLDGRRALTTLLDAGCGNGLLLSELREALPDTELTGVEFSADMAELARGRELERCEIVEGSVAELPFDDASFDVVVTERCLINLMDPGDQDASLAQIARVLRPGGHYVCVEAFSDGLANLNKAREELGLEPNQVPHHNLWIDKKRFLTAAERVLERRDTIGLGDPDLPPPNFLSSHYFVSRVLYPAITRAEVRYNTELVKFLSFLAPVGNYSPIQLFIFERPA